MSSEAAIPDSTDQFLSKNGPHGCQGQTISKRKQGVDLYMGIGHLGEGISQSVQGALQKNQPAGKYRRVNLMISFHILTPSKELQPLAEIFIYELGGVNYAVKDIVL